MRKLVPALSVVLFLMGCGDEPTVFDDQDGGLPVDEAGFDTSVPDVTADTSAGEDTLATADTGEADSSAGDVSDPDAGSDGAALETGPSDTGTDTGKVDSGPADTGSTDTGSTDTATVDSAPADTGVKADTGPVVCNTVACTVDSDCSLVGCGKCLGSGKCGN